MEYCKKPCKHCPYRNDIRPFLTLERTEELAYLPLNPYNEFFCHKTIEYDGEEDHQGRPTGDYSEIKLCAGFLKLRAQAGMDLPDGFEPSWEVCYIDEWEMISAGREELENKPK